MYTNNAYLNNSTVDRKDKSKPLVITMCGTYKLYTKPKLPTWRPRGRLDFQLLYIAAGKAHFHFGSDTEETIVPAGHMVLYRPKEPQKFHCQFLRCFLHIHHRYCIVMYSRMLRLFRYSGKC